VLSRQRYLRQVNRFLHFQAFRALESVSKLY